jgi:hypothetical protein
VFVIVLPSTAEQLDLLSETRRVSGVGRILPVLVFCVISIWCWTYFASTIVLCKVSSVGRIPLAY